jgi:uroporphyrinogen-III synthase
MQNRLIHILSTRPLESGILQEAQDNGIDISCISFIETKNILDDLIEKEISEIAKLQHTIVFTSMNAVEAVIESLNNTKPTWDIYCMGGTTKQLIVNYFGADAIKGVGRDAHSLGQQIIDANEKEVTFFCGNIRRDELPHLLSEENIQVKEIIVYETALIPQKIVKDYDGILFFSPSAVESFFSVNTIKSVTTLFAIGETTAKTISTYTSNTIIISDSPEKNSLAKKAIDYFSKAEIV